MTATFPTSQAPAVRSTGRASSRTTDRGQAARTALAEHLATHVMPLDDGPKGYRMFKDKEDGCVRAVFRPGG